METHTNHLHNAPGKNFWHYLFEFFMLFLAVFCGFLAENLREKLVDNENEKESIHSLINSLASDTSQLKIIIAFNNTLVQNLDSLILLKKADLTVDENKKKFYQYGSVGVLQEWFFKTNDAALQQLKSSGMLRLIKKQNIVDSIFGYESKNDLTMEQERDSYFYYQQSLADYKKVTDLTLLRDTSAVSSNMTLYILTYHFKHVNQLTLSSDEEKLDAVFNNAALVAIGLEVYVQFMQDQLSYGKKLIALLQREYHIQ
ncbi:MAG: hypothetical protein ACHQD9_03090 [Chitinophagales bacterium]